MRKLNISPYLSINNILRVSISYLKNISSLYYVSYKAIDANLCPMNYYTILHNRDMFYKRINKKFYT